MDNNEKIDNAIESNNALEENDVITEPQIQSTDTKKTSNKVRKISIIVITFLLIASAASFLIIKYLNTPKVVVTDFLNNIQANNTDIAIQYLANPNDNTISSFNNVKTQTDQDTIKQIFSKIKYEIISSSRTSKSAVVKAKITSLDLPSIFNQTITESMGMAFANAFSNKSENDTQNMFSQILLNKVSSPNAPLVVTEVDINLVKRDGKLLIDANENLYNALTGNLQKAFK